MEEIWKPVVGYEGYYEVSNLGNIRSLDRWIPKVMRGTPCESFYRVKVLTPVSNGKGYLFVNLQVKADKKHGYVHRIVAEAWIDNPRGVQQINHKDGNKGNNRVENLEWCTASENMRHSVDVLKNGNPMKGKSNKKNNKKVVLFIDGKPELLFSSQHECAHALGLNYCYLSSIIHNSRKSTYDLRRQ